MEALINEYISHELVSKPDLLPLKNGTPLLETGLLASLFVFKLALFLEPQFGVVINAEDLTIEYFQPVNAIVPIYVRNSRGCRDEPSPLNKITTRVHLARFGGCPGRSNELIRKSGGSRFDPGPKPGFRISA